MELSRRWLLLEADLCLSDQGIPQSKLAFGALTFSYWAIARSTFTFIGAFPSELYFLLIHLAFLSTLDSYLLLFIDAFPSELYFLLLYIVILPTSIVKRESRIRSHSKSRGYELSNEL